MNYLQAFARPALLALFWFAMIGAAPQPAAYTFHAEVAGVLHRFPWLHFHLSGEGEYVRGDRYVLRFTKVPSFAAGRVHDLDLAIVDQSMWANNFIVRIAGEQPGTTIYALQALHDPNFTGARVVVSAERGLQCVDEQFRDGSTIHMTVTTADVGGYALPSSIEVRLDAPGLAIAATAKFSSYSFAAPSDSR